MMGFGFNGFCSNGVLSIVAAIKGGTPASLYPASYPSVVSAAAIDPFKSWAEFSKCNNQVGSATPGVEFRRRSCGCFYFGSVGAWSGKVVLCMQGNISICDQVLNTQNGGGSALVIGMKIMRPPLLVVSFSKLHYFQISMILFFHAAL